MKIVLGLAWFRPRGKPTLRHNLAGFARRDSRVGSRLGAIDDRVGSACQGPVIDQASGVGHGRSILDAAWDQLL